MDTLTQDAIEDLNAYIEWVYTQERAEELPAPPNPLASWRLKANHAVPCHPVRHRFWPRSACFVRTELEARREVAFHHAWPTGDVMTGYRSPSVPVFGPL